MPTHASLPEPRTWLVDGEVVLTDQHGHIMVCPAEWPYLGRTLAELRTDRPLALVTPLVLPANPQSPQ